MKNLKTGEDNTITFPLAYEPESTYTVELNRIVGSSEIEFQNVADENDSGTIVNDYNNNDYSTSDYFVTISGLTSTLDKCFSFATLVVNIPSETLGGEYVLRVIGEQTAKLHFKGLAKIKSDYSLINEDDSSTPVESAGVYSSSKLL